MKTLSVSALFAFSLAAASPAAPRDIQITTVDFETSVLTLENVGDETESLNGWRFCSHDDNQVRRYSSAGGLNGVSLEAGDVLHLHFLNDAPAGDSERMNISAVGSVATPLDRGPYAIQLYFTPVSFGNGNTIADHLQWSIDGVDNTSADERSDEAQGGGVWVDQGEWIATSADSTRILLDDLSGGVLHSPSDYVVEGPTPEPALFELASITREANGDVTLTWPVQPDVEYEVQRGDDLEGFTSIGEPTTSGSFTDTSAPAGRSFYRVVGSFRR